LLKSGSEKNSLLREEDMANVHYGKIGDMWKHLPLAEVLSIEKPSIYWESHSGFAYYPLMRSADRDYGVFYFLKEAKKSATLKDSAYQQLLKRYAENRRPIIYPGSPLIAMSLLQTQSEKYLFCDTDENSLNNITETYKDIGIPDKIVEVKNADGVSTVYEAFSTLNSNDASKTVVHIDPYDTFETGKNGLTSIELFCQASKRGVKAFIWYGLGSINDHSIFLEYLMQTFKKSNFNPAAHNLWLGEIQLTAFKDVCSNYNPGVFGCGIICGNLSDKSLSVCKQLGEGLEQIYKSAKLPDGSSGAIKFMRHIW
jgi:23S rRNA A2030 N6-methylase RlmJ